MSNVSDASELERLRQLVGPSETGYAELRNDRDAAQRVAREAEAETGRLRGHIVELSAQLSRARQDQDLLQRQIEMNGWERLADRVQRRFATSVVPRVKRQR